MYFIIIVARSIATSRTYVYTYEYDSASGAHPIPRLQLEFDSILALQTLKRAIGSQGTPCTGVESRPLNQSLNIEIYIEQLVSRLSNNKYIHYYKGTRPWDLYIIVKGYFSSSYINYYYKNKGIQYSLRKYYLFQPVSKAFEYLLMFFGLLGPRPTIASVRRAIEATTTTNPNTLAPSTLISALVSFPTIEIPLNQPYYITLINISLTLYSSRLSSQISSEFSVYIITIQDSY